MDRQFIEIGNEGLYQWRLHISVHGSLVGKRLDEVQHRFVLGIDGHDTGPAQSFDIRRNSPIRRASSACFPGFASNRTLI